MKFSLWMESGSYYRLGAFVASMLSKEGRYDHLPRMVATDWLEEEGIDDNLVTMLRAAKEYKNKDHRVGFLFNDARHAVEQDIAQDRVSCNLITGVIYHWNERRQKDDKYKITSNGLTKVNSSNHFKPFDPNNAPVPVLKAILIILATRMSEEIGHDELNMDLTAAFNNYRYERAQFLNRMTQHNQFNMMCLERLMASLADMTTAMEHNTPISRTFASMLVQQLGNLQRILGMAPQNFPTQQPLMSSTAFAKKIATYLNTIQQAIAATLKAPEGDAPHRL